MVTDDSVISHLMVVTMAAAGSGKLDPASVLSVFASSTECCATELILVIVGSDWLRRVCKISTLTMHNKQDG